MKTSKIIISLLLVGFCGMNIFAEENQNAQNQAIKDAIAQETAVVTNVEAIPSEYLATVENGGKLENISYKTKDYFGDGSEITKKANIYLPADYSTDKKYCVLYLMHGIGGNENEWGLVTNGSAVKRMMDNLAAKGEIEPFIIVCPNGRSGKDFANTNSNYNSFYKFGEELRNDLIPFIDSNYSTIPDRDHRAMAGLSMGGMQTINIGICECLDLISYFGAFSAAPTSYQATRVAGIIQSKSEYPVHYFYNICGLEDNIAYGSASAAAKLLPRFAPEFEEGKNFTWQELHGAHSFTIWYLGFYNFAKIVFTK